MTQVPQRRRPSGGRSNAWLRDPEQPATPPTPGWVSGAYFIGGALYVGAGAIALMTANSGIIGALITLVPLLAIATFIARQIAEHDRDPSVAPMVIGAFVIRMIGAAARYWMAFGLYGGEADAKQYDLAGRVLGKQWRAFSPNFNVGPGKLAGTNFLKIVTGIIYGMSPMSRVSGFMVFAFLAFIGSLFYWRAFRIAFPTGEVHKYALLVLLFPSLVFWPSAIGKDAWMTLALGVTAYGAARMSAGRTASGLVTVLIGTLGVLMVRPHVAVCVFAGLALMMILILTQIRRMRRPIVPVLALLVFVAAGNVVMSRTSSYLGTPSLTQEDVSATLDSTQSHSAQGGSEFKAVRVNNPIKFPYAFVTVFYRPFPYEAHNGQQIVAGAEGLLLMVITWKSRKNLAGIFGGMRASPYIGYCLAYVVLFVIAFSAFSNFGLLARERTQVTPLFLALLAIPTRATLKQMRAEAKAASQGPATTA